MKNPQLLAAALLAMFSGFYPVCITAAAGSAPITYPLVLESACPAKVISISSRDGNKVPAIVRQPPGEGPFPVLIHLHGGLGTLSLEKLQQFSLRNVNANRFLAAGYITVVATFRSREKDPLTNDALVDCLAVVAHVKEMPQADPRSIVIWGDSGGGSLALEVAGETDLCAVTGQEPATVLFTGVFSPRNLGDPIVPYNEKWNMIMAHPRDYYTPELKRLTEAKIARIHCPIFIAHGDKHGINVINREIIIPALKAAGKPLQVIHYPGEDHGFSVKGPPATQKKFFDDTHAFFLRYLHTTPRPLPESCVKIVRTGRKAAE